VAVVPLASEARLRYHDWVAARAARVAERSDGRLGYLHVPDMGPTGWAQLERMVDEASRHEGVIADIRYNGGGNTSQLVLERLLRRVTGWDYGRYLVPAAYPAQAMRGPVVVLTNELAGSDGDIGTAQAKLHGLTVVGTRTWGGVIGIDGRFDLVDGTEVTQPRYASYIGDYGWGVENRGIDPDIEVSLAPDQWRPEDDEQLDVAIAEALRELEQRPAVVPPDLPAPRFGTARGAGTVPHP
jgi:tricorn protease